MRLPRPPHESRTRPNSKLEVATHRGTLKGALCLAKFLNAPERRDETSCEEVNRAALLRSTALWLYFGSAKGFCNNWPTGPGRRRTPERTGLGRECTVPRSRSAEVDKSWYSVMMMMTTMMVMVMIMIEVPLVL